MSSLSISSNMPISLSSLRVLDLSNGKLDDKSVENLFKWIILLKRLAHLNLSGAPGLKNVPRIRKLRNLQLLVLSGCSNLVSLNDSSIIYLKKLLILDLGSCDSLMFLPQGIGRLTKLEELSGFKLHRRENSQSCGLLELQNLVQLRVLRIKLSDESEILDNEWEALSRLEKLQVLAIDTENTKEPTNLQKLDRLKPPPGLEQVYLRHYRRNHLPEWINPKTLSKLQYLSIEFGDIKHFREEKWKLVGLCLKFLPLFEDDWKKLKQIMPSLCDVEVSNCPSLKNPPYEDKSWTSRNLLT
ncbi:disease resistance RPP13-like protein 4 isoform X2 [Jatropha curcas]|uniref:disease resistance RPP13-like protein 4 isoform X2 n=1 Tax=Jatropha curcas TaxID=180498 RepID=UPI0018938555|nr:disease resistance RPP13-like protein 4 isoform X2 [Jatropha curcas]